MRVRKAKEWSDELKDEIRRRYRHERGIFIHKTNSKASRTTKEGQFYKVGDIVKVSKVTAGHLKVSFSFEGKQYFELVHRIVFFLEHGYCPPVIDHIDGNPENNDPPNLREATQKQNTQNMRRNNQTKTSNFKGVHYNSRSGKWVAQIRDNEGNKVYIGQFDLEIDAAIVYNDYAYKYHGEFAVFNVI